jgi:hypothetical protein
MKIATVLIAAALGFHLPAAADDATRTAAYQSSVSQEQLRSASQRLKQEMVALAEEFGACRSAASEVAGLQAAIDSFDRLSDREMTEVVQSLATASRSADEATARGELVRANSRLKVIQSTLRSLADQLASQAGIATLQKRLEDLALRQSENMRATRELAAMAVSNDPSEPGRLEATEYLSMRKSEQQALEKEIGLAMETLRKVGESADPAFGKHLAIATAGARNLGQRTKAASNSLESSLSESADRQQEIYEALKTMASAMAGCRVEEERIRELADAVSELSQQERRLAAMTPRLDGRNRKQARAGQQEIATRLDLLKDRIAMLSERSVPETGAAIARSQNIADKIADPGYVKDARNLAIAAGAQRDLAVKLAVIGETLHQQADALAHLDPLPETQMSAEEKAVQDVMESLLDAKENNAIARHQNDHNQNFQETLAMARKDLAGAKQRVPQAGAEVAQGVDRFLEDAESHAAIAATGKEPEHNLYHVNANVDKALAVLQEAANKLATAGKFPAQGDGQGKGNSSGGIREGAGPRPHGRYAAGSASGNSRRDALTLLKQEKAAPDYESMVIQYIENLAEDIPEP